MVAGLLSLTLLLQLSSGTFSREFAWYPDEPSHYVTGQMVRDYIAERFPAPPMQFAKDYYAHYPKIGLGHWPPAFYVIQAAWTLVFGSARISILFLMALSTTVLAVLVAWRVRAFFGQAAGFCAGCLFIALPSVQRQTAMVMPEVLVALFGFAAAISFGRYLDTENQRYAIWFALFAALCILTKANGWPIVLLPPLAILLTRRLSLFSRPSLWVSGLLIALLCLPWYVLTTRFVRHVWIAEHSGPAYLGFNISETLASLANATGFLFFALAVLGLVVKCALPYYRREPVHGEWASLAALFIVVQGFHVAVPLEIEIRKLLMAVPPMLMLVAAGCMFLSERLRIYGRAVQMMPIVLPALAFLALTFRIPQKPAHGFIDAATTALASNSARSSIYLVSGTAVGEGAFIAEIAMRNEGRRRVVLRASKALAISDWNGANYQPLFRTTEEIHRHLNQGSVEVVVTEETSTLGHLPHTALLNRMLEERRDEWQPIGSHERVKVFRRTPEGWRATTSHSHAPKIGENAF